MNNLGKAPEILYEAFPVLFYEALSNVRCFDDMWMMNLKKKYERKL
jgi:hypothetical protein